MTGFRNRRWVIDSCVSPGLVCEGAETVVGKGPTVLSQQLNWGSTTNQNVAYTKGSPSPDPKVMSSPQQPVLAL
jgi:hypothetical protein